MVVSLNSRLESVKEEEKISGGAPTAASASPAPWLSIFHPRHHTLLPRKHSSRLHPKHHTSHTRNAKACTVLRPKQHLRHPGSRSLALSLSLSLPLSRARSLSICTCIAPLLYIGQMSLEYIIGTQYIALSLGRCIHRALTLVSVHPHTRNAPSTSAVERGGNNFNGFKGVRTENGSSQGLDCLICAMFAR